MIKLYQYLPAFGLPNPSPFCLKLETYLKMVDLSYEVIGTPDPRKAPKLKLPYIKDKSDIVADSDLIIKYLEKKYPIALDNALTKTQKAISFALTKTLEEHFYWTLVFHRWQDDRYWPTVKNVFFGGMPGIMRYFVPDLIRKSVLRDLRGHGMGRHSVEEVYQLGINDINAVADYLDEKPFVMGDVETTIDASAFAFIACSLHFPHSTPLIDAIKTRNNLLDYYRRMSGKYYPQIELAA